MSNTSKPAVTLHHRTFTIDARSWTDAYTSGPVAELVDALLSFTGALHDHVQRLDRLTVAALFIRARCGAGWSQRPNTGIFDSRTGIEAGMAVGFSRDFVAIGFADPVHGSCVVTMDANFHGHHPPVVHRQRPGFDWHWLRAVTLRCPAQHRWLLHDGLLYNADDNSPPLPCRDDQFTDDPAGTRLRCPSCGAATELTLLPLAVDVIVAPGGHGTVTPANRDGRARLADGALAQLLLDHLNTYPCQDFSPYDLAKVLGHSHGAIRTRLLALADTGEVVRARIRPARFRIARPTL